MQVHLTKGYLKNHSKLEAFLETGTFKGDCVQVALDAGFSKVLSCELNEELYLAAVERFKDEPRVKIYHGDSADCLAQMIQDSEGMHCTFWLDAHASGPLKGGKSGGTPVLDELKTIQNTGVQTHTIFVDDTRLFGSSEWSYVQKDDALDLIYKINPKYEVKFLDGHVKNDVLCAYVK